MTLAGYRGASGPRAGFGRRLAAALIDGLLIVTVLLLLSLAFRSVGYLIGLLLGIAYFTYFEGGQTGQTPGKQMLGIRVVDFDTGGPIGYGRGLIRYLGRAASSLILYLGYLWMFWDREAQTWHDKIASTVVVPVYAYPIGYHAPAGSSSSTPV